MLIALPVPEAAPHALPADAVHVQVTPVMAAGTVSASVAPTTSYCPGNVPVLVIAIVNVTGCPGT